LFSTPTCELQALLDLAGIYRAWNTKYNTWSIFGQDHVARVLMNYPVASNHDAVGDAIKSVRLYNLSQQLQQDPEAWQQAQVCLSSNCPMPCTQILPLHTRAFNDMIVKCKLPLLILQ